MINPRVSIILVTFNSHRTIRALLKSILNLNWVDMELMLVDNGSNDDTTTIIKEMMPELQKKLSVNFLPRTQILVYAPPQIWLFEKHQVSFFVLLIMILK